jgi:hypothetical protein
MKKTVLLLSVFFTSILLNAQGNFSFGAEVNESYSSVVFSNNNFSYIEEHGNFNLGGSVFTELSLSDKFSMSLGLGYSQVSSKTPKYSVGWVDVSGTVTATTIPEEVRFIYKHSYISIPLLFHFKLSDNFRLTAGEISNFNISNRTTGKIYSSSGTSSSTDPEIGVDFKTFVPSAYFGFGWDFLHTDSFRMFLAPHAKLQLTNIADNVNLNRKFLSFGLSLGIVIN